MKFIIIGLVLLAAFLGVYYTIENNDAAKLTPITEGNGSISESDIAQSEVNLKSQTVQIPTHHSVDNDLGKSIPPATEPPTEEFTEEENKIKNCR